MLRLQRCRGRCLLLLRRLAETGRLRLQRRRQVVVDTTLRRLLTKASRLRLERGLVSSLLRLHWHGG